MRSRDDATRGRSDGVTSCDNVTVSPRDGVTSGIIGQPFRAAEVSQPRVGVVALRFLNAWIKSPRIRSSSTRSAKVTVSSCEVPDRTETCPPAGKSPSA